MPCVVTTIQQNYDVTGMAVDIIRCHYCWQRTKKIAALITAICPLSNSRRQNETGMGINDSLSCCRWHCFCFIFGTQTLPYFPLPMQTFHNHQCQPNQIENALLSVSLAGFCIRLPLTVSAINIDGSGMFNLSKCFARLTNHGIWWVFGHFSPSQEAA